MKQQRAWMIITAKRSGSGFNLVAKNVGITPSKVLGLYAKWAYYESADGSTNDWVIPPKYGSLQFIHKRLVPAGNEWEPERADRGGLGLDLDVDAIKGDAESWVEVCANKKRVMFWGRLTYLDIFDSQHETRFCFWFNPLFNELWVSGPEGYNEHT